MPTIGNMLWRIGALLGIGEQLAWSRDAGFEGVGFHASAGVAGQWRGIDPGHCTAADRQRLRGELADFAFVEVHAPLGITLRDASLRTDLTALGPTLAFAGDVGARVLTVHATLPAKRDCPDAPDAWLDLMRELAARAAAAQLTVGLEITDGFDAVVGWGLPSVGVTLDVGHMLLPAYRHILSRNGGFGPLIRRLGNSLVHLHLHDVAGTTDHVEIGTGTVPFGEIAEALRHLAYRRSATLELNPDRVSPEGIRRSADRIRAWLHPAGPV